ncbi:MAG: phosphonoacetaldehyde hydrolase [Geminicoccaceae bacterium]|nr:MAG: phosphonoacetaldehyde hydrolase [Geminicoccaceae bacterium]
MTQLQAVVFDWAGTVVDHGSLAPMGVFVRAFAEFGVEISLDEARGPMGMAKRDHIQAVMALPRVRQAWQDRHGTQPGEADIDRVYEVFVPLNVQVVTDHAELIEGTARVVAGLRAQGLMIGSTTGYTREIMAPLLPKAAAQGFSPDSLVCAGDLPKGRPHPAMMYRTFLELGTGPAWTVVKVDDTGVGLGEGLNAGTWTVGVALTGNAFGLSPTDTQRLAPADFAARKAKAYATLHAAGAHLVIDGIHDLPAALAQLEGRLARGERP